MSGLGPKNEMEMHLISQLADEDLTHDGVWFPADNDPATLLTNLPEIDATEFKVDWSFSIESNLDNLTRLGKESTLEKVSNSRLTSVKVVKVNPISTSFAPLKPSKEEGLSVVEIKRVDEPVCAFEEQFGRSNEPNIANERLVSRLHVALKAIANDFALLLKRNAEQVHDPNPISFAPISVVPPVAAEVKAAESSTPSTQESAKKRARATPMGEMSFSFELPSDLQAACINWDQLLVPVPGGNTARIQHQMSFRDRLKGWRVQCRRRVSGKLDMYYHHHDANRIFRSVVEVIDFIIHESYPGKLGAMVISRESPPAKSSPSMEVHKPRGLLKRKIPPPDIGRYQSNSPPTIDEEEITPDNTATASPPTPSKISRAGEPGPSATLAEAMTTSLLQEAFSNLVHFFHLRPTLGRCRGREVPRPRDVAVGQSSGSGTEDDYVLVDVPVQYAKAVYVANPTNNDEASGTRVVFTIMSPSPSPSPSLSRSPPPTADAGEDLIDHIPVSENLLALNDELTWLRSSRE